MDKLAEAIYKYGIPYGNQLVVGPETFKALNKLIEEKGKPNWLVRQEKLHENIRHSSS